MTEESYSTTSHLSVAMTTTDVADEEAMISSSSDGATVYFQCAVVVIGVVGAAANALILYAMIASDQNKKYLLIFNQNLCDLCSCLLLVVTHAVSLCNIYLTGTLGYWLCMILLSENLLWCAIDASVINLLSITVERYLKVVYPALGKKLLRKWVIYSIAAFAWIASITYNMVFVFTTSGVVHGVCYSTVLYMSPLANLVNTIWYFVSSLVIVVPIFVFCYGHILAVIRRQARIMAGHSVPGLSTAQTQSQHIQSNVIKTMTFIIAFYVITWMPIKCYYLLIMLVNINFFNTAVYYITIFMGFLYICANPFIYATKFDPVKRILVGLIPCKKSQQAGVSVNMTTTRIAVQTYN